MKYLRNNKMCPLEHFFDNHELCYSSWCEKKRNAVNVRIDTEIDEFDKESTTNTNNNTTATDPHNNFTISAAGYYRSKVIDKEKYQIMLSVYE